MIQDIREMTRPGSGLLWKNNLTKPLAPNLSGLRAASVESNERSRSKSRGRMLFEDNRIDTLDNVTI
jgi:hypothetical protein